MNKLITVLIAAFIMAVSLGGCTATSYTHQVEDSSYVLFTGDFMGSKVLIGSTEINLTDQTKTFDLNGKTVAKFPVDSGKTLMTVIKNNKTIIKKHIFLSEGQTLEVQIP